MITRTGFECSLCRERGPCPVSAGAEEPSARPEDRGASLVGAAIIVFLLPLATAIAAAFVGSRLAAPRPESAALWQVGGAGLGLLAGVVVARVLTALGRAGEPE